MNATELDFPSGLFSMLQGGRLLSSMDEIIEMKATKQYFSCGAVYCAVQDGSNV